MTHFEAVEVIASRLTNQIVISNVGNTNRELYSVKKHKLTLYGVNMSLVTPLAFGLAKAIPQRERHRPRRLRQHTHGLKKPSHRGNPSGKEPACFGSLDNGCYAACGWIPTATGRGVDLAGIATATGFKNVKVVNEPGDLSTALDVMLGKRRVSIPKRMSSRVRFPRPLSRSPSTASTAPIGLGRRS